MQTWSRLINPAATRHTAAIALAVALAVQLAVLYWPSVSISGPVSWSDKVVHLTVFAVPTLLARVRFPRRVWPVLALAAHAPVSELVQHAFLPHRSGDIADALTDLAGVAAGLAAAWWWGSRVTRSKAPASRW